MMACAAKVEVAGRDSVHVPARVLISLPNPSTCRAMRIVTAAAAPARAAQPLLLLPPGVWDRRNTFPITTPPRLALARQSTL